MTPEKKSEPTSIRTSDVIHTQEFPARGVRFSYGQAPPRVRAFAQKFFGKKLPNKILQVHVEKIAKTKTQKIDCGFELRATRI